MHTRTRAQTRAMCEPMSPRGCGSECLAGCIAHRLRECIVNCARGARGNEARGVTVYAERKSSRQLWGAQSGERGPGVASLRTTVQGTSGRTKKGRARRASRWRRARTFQLRLECAGGMRGQGRSGLIWRGEGSRGSRWQSWGLGGLGGGAWGGCRGRDKTGEG